MRELGGLQRDLGVDSKVAVNVITSEPESSL